MARRRAPRQPPPARRRRRHGRRRRRSAEFSLRALWEEGEEEGEEDAEMGSADEDEFWCAAPIRRQRWRCKRRRSGRRSRRPSGRRRRRRSRRRRGRHRRNWAASGASLERRHNLNLTTHVSHARAIFLGCPRAANAAWRGRRPRIAPVETITRRTRSSVHAATAAAMLSISSALSAGKGRASGPWSRRWCHQLSGLRRRRGAASPR